MYLLHMYMYAFAAALSVVSRSSVAPRPAGHRAERKIFPDNARNANTTPNTAKFYPYDQKYANIEIARIDLMNASICMTLHTESKSERRAPLGISPTAKTMQNLAFCTTYQNLASCVGPVLSSNFFQ